MGRVGGGSQPWQVKSVLGGRLSFDREEGRGRAATKGALLRSWPPPPDLRDAQRGGARGRPGTPLRAGRRPLPQAGSQSSLGGAKNSVRWDGVRVLAFGNSFKDRCLGSPVCGDWV